MFYCLQLHVDIVNHRIFSGEEVNHLLILCLSQESRFPLDLLRMWRMFIVLIKTLKQLQSHVLMKFSLISLISVRLILQIYSSFLHYRVTVYPQMVSSAEVVCDRCRMNNIHLFIVLCVLCPGLIVAVLLCC